ncbi:MAG: hypothetical protein WA981_05140 [Glaciecola sp.]
MTHKLTVLAVFSLIMCGSLQNAQSQEVQEITPVYFGTVVVLDNSTVGSIRIDEFGNTTVSTHFAVIDPPRYGEFRLVNFVPNSILFITGGIIQAGTTSPQVSPEQFTLNAVNVRATIRVDADGNAEFRVGGELVTSGSNSLAFGNQTYTSRLSITVDY